MTQKKLSEMIRDLSYLQTQDEGKEQIQREVIESIIRSHPEGITDYELSLLTGYARTSITARRNTIAGVIPLGYAKIIFTEGTDRLNTLWGFEK
jgi:hypothetical protein